MASFGVSDALCRLHDGHNNRGAPRDGGAPLMDKGAHAAEAATGVFRDLDVQNRMLGTAGYFTLAFPLMVDSGSQIAEGKAIKAKL
jgi:hypothetical protein